MRVIALLILGIVVLSLLGWITFVVTDNNAGVTIETQQIKSDTEEVFEAGKSVLHDARDALDRDDPDLDSDTANPRHAPVSRPSPEVDAPGSPPRE